MGAQNEYLADVNKQGLKTIVITADSEEEALDKAIEEWGEENIIIPPHESDCLERIDSVKNENRSVW